MKKLRATSAVQSERSCRASSMPARNFKPFCATSMKNFDEADWHKTRALLRAHLTAPGLEHPDFVNSRVLEEIEREKKRPRTPAFVSLRRLAWSGIAAIVLAVILTLVVLPHQVEHRSDGEFISQVVTARAEMPQLSVSEFRAPDERGVVIWLEGVDYIPAEDSVR
jgi:anti-sigma factor RsiW